MQRSLFVQQGARRKQHFHAGVGLEDRTCVKKMWIWAFWMLRKTFWTTMLLNSGVPNSFCSVSRLKCLLAAFSDVSCPACSCPGLAGVPARVLVTLVDYKPDHIQPPKTTLIMKKVCHGCSAPPRSVCLPVWRMFSLFFVCTVLNFLSAALLKELQWCRLPLSLIILSGLLKVNEHRVYCVRSILGSQALLWWWGS